MACCTSPESRKVRQKGVSVYPDPVRGLRDFIPAALSMTRSMSG